MSLLRTYIMYVLCLTCCVRNHVCVHTWPTVPTWSTALGVNVLLPLRERNYFDQVWRHVKNMCDLICHANFRSGQDCTESSVNVTCILTYLLWTEPQRVSYQRVMTFFYTHSNWLVHSSHSKCTVDHKYFFIFTPPPSKLFHLDPSFSYVHYVSLQHPLLSTANLHLSGFFPYPLLW